MKHAVLPIALTDREVSGEIPLPGTICCVAFVPNPSPVKAPGVPPDMPVIFVDCDLDAPKRTRRFVVLRNGEQIDDTSDRPVVDGEGGAMVRRERAEYCGTAVSAHTGLCIHVFEMVDVADEALRLTFGQPHAAAPPGIIRRLLQKAP
jgi:hypothetical protein